jgi:hypothetical protein
VATSFLHSRGMRDGGEASLSVGGGGIADSIEALQRAPEPSFSVYDVMCARKDVAEAGETPSPLNCALDSSWQSFSLLR